MLKGDVLAYIEGMGGAATAGAAGARCLTLSDVLVSFWGGWPATRVCAAVLHSAAALCAHNLLLLATHKLPHPLHAGASGVGGPSAAAAEQAAAAAAPSAAAAGEESMEPVVVQLRGYRKVGCCTGLALHAYALWSGQLGGGNGGSGVALLALNGLCLLFATVPPTAGHGAAHDGIGGHPPLPLLRGGAGKWLVYTGGL